MIRDLVLKNRTYRTFYQNEKITMNTLKELIDLARVTSSGMNMQSLKYVLSNSEDKNEKIFNTLKWAGYLKDWDGPTEGEKPSAYIVMLQDLTLSKNSLWDSGLAAQSILLGAVEKGFGGCMFGNVDRKTLAEELQLGEEYSIIMVIALGKPKEVVKLEPLSQSGDIKYYRDEDGVHHVPKRALEDLILDK
ncbi:nitroreductase family protein [Clostridium sp. CX1]|uniref:Nitroreductase family protein n=1 Tax=Clostridium tanneri TaxID=3037988 RepID=A0ABU4JTA7_9CLOT|nr:MULTISPECIES: nitroreductase family protein [unclassified Clostridium]MCT8975377.1 nitroreductase family protein [Clostridium sp. CX1]MDW8801392.1 nitroreductase family protein [Clostridium sp. A1-XYC3]